MMKKIITAVVLSTLFLGCGNEDVNPSAELESKLLGKWEITEKTFINDEGQKITYTYGENGDFKVAYTIGIDYSSGFELKENNILDLIWGGRNKDQFFSWHVSNQELIIDGGTLTFEIIELDDSMLEIEVKHYDEKHGLSLKEGETWFKMERFD